MNPQPHGIVEKTGTKQWWGRGACSGSLSQLPAEQNPTPSLGCFCTSCSTYGVDAPRTRRGRRPSPQATGWSAAVEQGPEPRPPPAGPTAACSQAPGVSRGGFTRPCAPPPRPAPSCQQQPQVMEQEERNTSLTSVNSHPIYCSWAHAKSVCVNKLNGLFRIHHSD